VSLLQAWSWAKGAPIGQRCCAPFAQRFGALRSGGLYPQKPNRITKV